MGYIEHRRDKWSFIGDLAYLKLAADDSTASDKILQVELDVEFEQTVIEGFVGYRILEREYDTAGLGLDLLIGARYTQLEADLSAEASLLGLAASADRNLDEDWTCATTAIRRAKGLGRHLLGRRRRRIRQQFRTTHGTGVVPRRR
jgi:hypothetical protein